MAHIFRRCSSSGNGGPGGTLSIATKPFISSGACVMNSLYHFITSAASSSFQSIGPAQTVCTGWPSNKNDVTTPKFPPPPRIAQNKSGFSLALATTNLPSASTRSAASRLSMVRPYFRVRCPSPPPSVKPPTPVVEIIPDGTANPNACVAWSTSPQVHPPPTRTVFVVGSTCTYLMRERSMTRPSSHTPKPPALWPPPRIDTFTPCCCPN